jgi:single-stranded-DNA-specific exonuclease
LSHTHWNLLPPAEKSITAADVHPLVAQILYNRGISAPSQIELFLGNDRRSEADPLLLPDMPGAVIRTNRALYSGEKIAIYGDFDADGITATALLVQGLLALGGRVIPYIPHRSSEGYGLRTSAIEKLQQQGVSLIITVDTGITAVPEVEKAQKMGMDIIITDHHIPPSQLPRATAVVNPKRSDSDYPFSDLAGVGVAFKFLQALIPDKGSRQDIVNRTLDLVALGTVADMVPLLGENRYWVKAGLELMNKTKRIGLQELMRCSRLQPGTLDAQSISWTLGPRINAAGRIDSATTSYRLLMTDDIKEASSLATELEKKNAERLRQTNALLDKARQAVIAMGTEQPLLMVGGEDYTPGVMGLVAGRLADKFYRPVILLKIGQEFCRGSGRSIDEFNIMSALERCSDLLSNFGGHTRAAGFSVPTSNLPQFQQRMFTIAKEMLDGLDLRPHINIDAEVSLSTFAGDTYEKLQQLEPFGSGNPLPAFVSRKVEVMEQRLVGSQNEHLKLKVKQSGVVWDAMGFGLGSCVGEIKPYMDLVYNLDLDRWNGTEKLRLSLLDFEPSQ